ncbi:hypothetical protein [Nostoc phage A1]|nr:hypothetical protein [Nostoc phage A1]
MRELKLNDNGRISAEYAKNRLVGGLNRWYSFDNGMLDLIGNTTNNGGNIRYFPIVIPRPVLIDSATMNVSTALTGGTFRIGIYDNAVVDNKSVPNNRIIDMGEQPLTAGIKTFPISPFAINDGFYWVAVAPSGNTGFSGVVTKATGYKVLGTSTFVTNADLCLTETFTYASMVNGELPLIANPNAFDTRYMLTLFRVINFL